MERQVRICTLCPSTEESLKRLSNAGQSSRLHPTEPLCPSSASGEPPSRLPRIHSHPCWGRAGPRGWGGCCSYLDVVLPAVSFLEVLCSIGQSLRSRAQGGQRLREARAQPKAFSIPSIPRDQAGSGTSSRHPARLLDMLQLAVGPFPHPQLGSHSKGDACTKGPKWHLHGTPCTSAQPHSCPQDGRGSPGHSRLQDLESSPLPLSTPYKTVSPQRQEGPSQPRVNCHRGQSASLRVHSPSLPAPAHPCRPHPGFLRPFPTRLSKPFVHLSLALPLGLAPAASSIRPSAHLAPCHADVGGHGSTGLALSQSGAGNRHGIGQNNQDGNSRGASRKLSTVGAWDVREGFLEEVLSCPEIVSVHLKDPVPPGSLGAPEEGPLGPLTELNAVKSC